MLEGIKKQLGLSKKDVKKEKVIHVRITERMYKKLKEKAMKNDETISGYVRFLILLDIKDK
jgi:hypothetical protein